MAKYILLPVERDPADSEITQVEVIHQNFPEWRPDGADGMTLLLRANAVLIGDLMETASRVGEEVFRYFGRGLAGIPVIDELPATGQVLITAKDDDGPYVVPEGLELIGLSPLGEQIGFRTIAEAVIPNGSLTITLDVEASEDGEQGNGVSGDADFSEYRSYLTAVEFVGTTSGGRDRELDERFLDRLAEELGLPRRPVRPQDFEVYARRLGAFRATGLNGFDPSDDSENNRAMIALSMVDDEGEPLPDAAAIVAQIQAMREVGFSVPYEPPSYSTVKVFFEVTAYPGRDLTAVKAACVSILQNWLSPATWGLRDDTGEDRSWLNDPKVRILAAAERLKRVTDVWHVDSVTLAIGAGALDDVDVTMSGRAPLPRPGVIDGTVTAAT